MTDAIWDLGKLRVRLETERARLLTESDAQREERGPEALDPSRVGRLSRMDALQVRAMAGATAERRRTRVARIDAALTRLDAGEFGVCLECGERIASKRLELDPTIALCIGCAESEP